MAEVCKPKGLYGYPVPILPRGTPRPYNNLYLSHDVLVIPRSINLRPRYQPKSFSSRAENGQGLILRGITKTM